MYLLYFCSPACVYTIHLSKSYTHYIWSVWNHRLVLFFIRLAPFLFNLACSIYNDDLTLKALNTDPLALNMDVHTKYMSKNSSCMCKDRIRGLCRTVLARSVLLCEFILTYIAEVWWMRPSLHNVAHSRIPRLRCAVYALRESIERMEHVQLTEKFPGVYFFN